MRKHRVLLFRAWMGVSYMADALAAGLTWLESGIDRLGYWLDGKVLRGWHEHSYRLGLVSLVRTWGGVLLDHGGGVWNVKHPAFGAKIDVVTLSDAAITASDTTLTSASATFVAADVGKLIQVAGAGASGASLFTTIASRTSATEVELTASASTTVSGAEAHYGTDNATAIQAAIDKAEADGGVVWIAGGTGAIGSNLGIGGASISIGGAGISETQIIALSASVTVGFEFDDTAANLRFTFRDFTFNGNGVAQHGFLTTDLDHGYWDRVRVLGCTTAGISTAGNNNDFHEVEVSNGSGDGIRLTGSDNNAVNLRGVKLFTLDGLGLHVSGGLAVNMEGGTVEACKKSGVYLQGTAAGPIRIVGTYFQSNGQDGFAFTTPSLTVKADIIINGSASSTTMARSSPIGAVVIEGNHANGVNAESFIYTAGANEMAVRGNYTASAFPLIEIHGEKTFCQAGNVVIEANDGFSRDLVVDNTAVSGQIIDPSKWRSDKVRRRNYFDPNHLTFTTLAARSGGSVARADAEFNGFPVFEITGAAQTDVFGRSLDASTFPELQDQYVHLSAYVKADSGETGTVYVQGNDNTFQSTDWVQVGFLLKMPDSTSARLFGFGKNAGTGGGKVYFANPVVAIVGAHYDGFYDRPYDRARWWQDTAAPTAGTWEVGDIVWNTAPSAGGTIAWVCTTAGGAGTFVFKTWGSIAA